MPYIKLTRGQFAIVDSDDFENLNKFKWHAHKERSEGFRAYRHISGTRNKSIQMSTHIMGKKEGYFIDHINRNKLDYRRKNLRWATFQENCRNRVRIKSSGLPQGVTKNGNGFSARICINKGKKTFLGFFKNPESAFIAYKRASNLFFGDFSPYSNV